MTRAYLSRAAFALALSAVLTTTVSAQGASCSGDAIDWFVPGQFERAVDEATTRQRIVIVKGIAFGIDKAGAKSARKGTW